MDSAVGVRELRQNLSRYPERVKAGEAFVVTERGHEVARLTPSGDRRGGLARLIAERGASIPRGDLIANPGATPPRRRPLGVGRAVRAARGAPLSTGATLAYLDTSAYVKLIVDEPESAALHRELGRWSAWTSSALLGVEAVRACRRLDLGAVFSYDERLSAAAAAAGLRILAPS